MATRPPHVTAQLAVLTRANSQAALNHVLNVTIGDTNHHLRWALEHYGVDDLEGLLTMPFADVDTLQYVDQAGPAPHPPAQALLPARRNLIKAWLGLHANYSRDLGGPIDVLTVLNDDYNMWRISGYDPTQPVVPYAAPIPVAAAAVAAAPRHTPAESFQKGVRKSADNYPVFESDKAWHSFQRKVQAAACLDQTENVLDTAYAPGTAEETDLFNAQNNYMMQVFEKIMQTNVSKNFVREHTGQNDTAQCVWRDLRAWAETSVAGDNAREKFRNYLTTKKLDDNFHGTNEISSSNGSILFVNTKVSFLAPTLFPTRTRLTG